MKQFLSNSHASFHHQEDLATRLGIHQDLTCTQKLKALARETIKSLLYLHLHELLMKQRSQWHLF